MTLNPTDSDPGLRTETSGQVTKGAQTESTSAPQIKSIANPQRVRWVPKG